jgi:hypothetical protein
MDNAEENVEKEVAVVEEKNDAVKKMLTHRNDDYEYGRELLYHAAEQLQELLGTAVTLAREAEHPRAIDVAKDTATTLADIAGKMMKHHEQTQKVAGEVPEKTTPRINNNLNVKLSSKELLDLLSKDD